MQDEEDGLPKDRPFDALIAIAYLAIGAFLVVLGLVVGAMYSEALGTTWVAVLLLILGLTVIWFGVLRLARTFEASRPRVWATASVLGIIGLYGTSVFFD